MSNHCISSHRFVVRIWLTSSYKKIVWWIFSLHNFRISKIIQKINNKLIKIKSMQNTNLLHYRFFSILTLTIKLARYQISHFHSKSLQLEEILGRESWISEERRESLQYRWVEWAMRRIWLELHQRRFLRDARSCYNNRAGLRIADRRISWIRQNKTGLKLQNSWFSNMQIYKK